MGGYGSGKWQSDTARETVEGHFCLNIFKLRHEGVMQGSWSSGTFSRGENRVSFSRTGDLLTLDYQMTSGPNAGLSLHYAIQIFTTTPHFGGVRYWFSCPTCGKRVGKLYLARTQFECRTCGNLAYQSTRELSWAKATKSSRRSLFRQM